MSKIFNYSHVKDVVSKTGGAFLPGELGAITPNDIIAAAIVDSDEVVENGQLVKLDTAVDHTTIITKIAAIASPSSAEELTGDNVFGVIVKDVHAQRLGEDEGFIYSYKKSAVSVARVAYVWVPVQDNGDITANAQVYVRVKDKSDGVEIGGIETSRKSATVGEATVYYSASLKGAKFTGRVGYPLSATTNGTTSDAKTARCAEIKLELGILA